jgi:hypothetical protein
MISIILLILVIVVVTSIIIIIFLPFDSENYKKCQHCFQKVKIESVICKFCKKDLVDLPYRK